MIYAHVVDVPCIVQVIAPLSRTRNCKQT